MQSCDAQTDTQTLTIHRKRWNLTTRALLGKLSLNLPPFDCDLSPSILDIQPNEYCNTDNINKRIYFVRGCELDYLILIPICLGHAYGSVRIQIWLRRS